ncbi:hypothetical protein WISP_23337 [Willisornis vidua]|uniref:Uncharacterized protein n=1 Tax=Willisornis vidua TaxID=1566151 RepID=A0ABQ9DTE7_9PASS|nr:hypothetical protein WISP_23337 [Willisornis vidua]
MAGRASSPLATDRTSSWSLAGDTRSSRPAAGTQVYRLAADTVSTRWLRDIRFTRWHRDNRSTRRQRDNRSTGRRRDSRSTRRVNAKARERGGSSAKSSSRRHLIYLGSRVTSRLAGKPRETRSACQQWDSRSTRRVNCKVKEAGRLESKMLKRAKARLPGQPSKTKSTQTAEWHHVYPGSRGKPGLPARSGTTGLPLDSQQS